MSFKTFLVHVEAGPKSENRVRIAAFLAQKFDGHVVGLGASTIDPAVTDFGHLNGSVYQQQIDAIRAGFRDAEALFHIATLSDRSSWSVAVDFPTHAMALRSGGADLIVTSRPEKSSKCVVASPGDLVMETGTPVLLIPDNRMDMSVRNIVVGWKDTRESRRALRDVMPLLAHAEAVFLVQVTEKSEIDGTERTLAEVAERLARHGIVAHTEVLSKSPNESIAEALEDAADRHSADLIAVGAYGHSRFTEWALGGVTQELMDASSHFILFSH